MKLRLPKREIEMNELTDKLREAGFYDNEVAELVKTPAATLEKHSIIKFRKAETKYIQVTQGISWEEARRLVYENFIIRVNAVLLSDYIEYYTTVEYE